MGGVPFKIGDFQQEFFEILQTSYVKIEKKKLCFFKKTSRAHIK
jgi:hypothetical protein